jgi:hypothetical protein
MKEYQFPKAILYTCYISILLTIFCIVIALCNWLNGLWFAISAGLFWVPLFVFIGYKNSTGRVKFDENIFEIKSKIFGGSNVKAEWINLKEIKIQQRFGNIILNFGKNGFASFGTDRLDFKLFALSMTKLIADKKELSEITKNILFAKNINENEFEELDNKWKKQQFKNSVLMLLQGFLTLLLMFVLVLSTTKIMNVYHFQFNKRIATLFAPVVVLSSLYISNKIVSYLFKQYFKNKNGN